VTADLLDGGRPKRLILRQGRWILEMMRLVSTGEGVFQPRSTRIEGKQAVIETLRRSKNGKTLVDAATKIVSNGSASEDASFDAVDGAWVPSRLAPSYIDQLKRTEARSPVEAALIADLTMLRASHEGLMARVARLERLLGNQLDGEVHPFSVKPERLRQATPHAATLREGLPPRGELESDASGRDEPGEYDDAHADDAPRGASARHHERDDRTSDAEGPAAGDADERAYSDAGQPGADDADDPARAETSDALRFPALGLITDALKQLCGHEIPLKEMRNAPSPWLDSPSRFHASWFVDDAGEMQGGVVCDLEAVARLGGAYLAMSQADIEAQVAAEHPGEDLVSAASDICNTLAGLVNDVRGNRPVRASPLSPLEAGPPPWLDSPGTRMVCMHPGGGTVAFVGR
jgi:hypothetical protein